MTIELNDSNLTDFEKKEIQILLDRLEQTNMTDLEEMWYLMDLVWDDYKCNNIDLNWDKIGEFYSHPVWLLNGLFIEQHKQSMDHRDSISNWIVEKKLNKVVDYGGGFGTLARLIAEKSSMIDVEIYEPHPSAFGLKRAAEYNNINIIENLSNDYDCLLSTDVLEHVADPLKDFSLMIDSVKVGGYLIIANAFYPMIKCHLPQNYHLRYSFNFIAENMGIVVVGKLKGSHATIFKKVDSIEYNWNKIHCYEHMSSYAFPIIEFFKPVLKLIRRLVKK